jgi:hypothetical protein
MSLRLLYYALWIAPVPVLVCLAIIMVRRKLHKEFPLFFAFVAVQFADFAINFSAYHQSQQLYFCTYWTFAAVGIGFGFAVLYEVFTAVFRPFTDLREFGGVLFRWAAVVLATAALLMSTSSGPVPGWRVFTVILNAIRSLEIMQCGLVLLMLLCSAYLGITVRHRIFGIALGFGVMGAMDLIAAAVFASFGSRSLTFFQLSRMVAFNLSSLVWMGYLHAGEVQRQPTKQFSHAERWDYALAVAVHPGSHSPALPLIENAVDRVWEQANGHSGDGDDSPHNVDQ